jgi:Uncharacterized protein conserved in bacteria (DUF2330)
MRNARALGPLVGLTITMGFVHEREARACGGCIPPPTEIESVITDEKMILSISKDQTTLYDEIQYSGKPSSFAWVLPIKGEVTVGLSADILFSTLEAQTATEVVQPTPNCPPTSCHNFAGPGGSLQNGSGGSAGTGGGGVTVLSQKQVGPYETVQLKSSDGSALDKWLASHGYELPAADKPVVAAYVAEHFDFLALKLIPGEGVNTMQPVRVTSKGASISLPLHMVAVGTGPTTGITIWVVADGRWEPSNFPTFMIESNDIAWDWATGSSNYETVRLANEAKLGGRGWQIESSLEQNQVAFRNAVITSVEGSSLGNYSPTEATSDAGAGEAGAGDSGATEAGAGDAGAGEAGEGDGGFVVGHDSGLFGDLTGPANEDLDVLFAGISGQSARITRMRSDVAHSALSTDMALEAAADQSERTNTLSPTQEIGQPECPVYNDNCIQTGTAPRDQAIASQNGGCSATRTRSGTRTTVALVVSALLFAATRRRRRAR